MNPLFRSKGCLIVLALGLAACDVPSELDGIESSELAMTVDPAVIYTVVGVATASA